jgi:hypothetical protein
MEVRSRKADSFRFNNCKYIAQCSRCFTLLAPCFQLTIFSHSKSVLGSSCFRFRRLSHRIGPITWGCHRPPCWVANVVVQWLALLPLIREVPGSSLGLMTCYSDWGISCFPSVPPGKFQDSTFNWLRPLPSTSFSIHHSPIMNKL